MTHAPHLALALAGLVLGSSARASAAPVLDLEELCADGVQPEFQHCPACSETARRSLCAMYRGGLSPFTPEEIEESGDFRRILGFVFAGLATLCAGGAVAAFAVGFGDAHDVDPLLGIGGFMLSVGALGFGIAAPLLVRSGNKRYEAADMLRSFPPFAPPRPAAMLRLSCEF